MRRALLAPGHPDVTYTLSALALLHHDEGDCGTALPLLGDALKGWHAAFGRRHVLALKTEGLLGHCLARPGRYGEAETRLLSSRAALDSVVGSDHRETRTVSAFLVELFEMTGDTARAHPYRAPAPDPNPG